MKKYIVFVYALLCAATVLLFASNAKATPINNKLELMIREIAIAEGIDPNLAVAIAEVESRMNPSAIGTLGEIGLFQLRPEYHRVSTQTVRASVVTAMKYLRKVKNICEPKYGTAWFIGFNLGPYYSRQIKYPKLFPYYVKVMGKIQTRIVSNE